MTTSRYKRLETEWKHFAVGNATSERCGKTDDALRHVVEDLRCGVAPASVKINLTETLPDKTRIAESNETLMNKTKIEDLPAAGVVSTTCQSCGTLTCGSTCCRAIEIGNDRYLDIPPEIIKKAAYRVPGVNV